MKKLVILFVVTILTAALFSACDGSASQRVKLDEEHSTFSDFIIDNDQVYITCMLAIDNLTGEEIKITITAVSMKDVTKGLLQSPELKGFNEDLGSVFLFCQRGKPRSRLCLSVNSQAQKRSKTG